MNAPRRAHGLAQPVRFVPCLVAALALLLPGAAARAAQPKQPLTDLDQKAFFKPELHIGSAHVPLADIQARLPNQAAWNAFFQERAQDSAAPVHVFIDPRSGAVTNIIGAFPIIPGTGAGNAVTSDSPVDVRVVAWAVRRFVLAHRDLLGIDVSQLGEFKAMQVTPELWQVTAPQRVAGVPVRYGRLAATISHGNLVVIGTETWGNAQVDVLPHVDARNALEVGFAFVEGRADSDLILREPRLEIVPTAPLQQQQDDAFVGAVGTGYEHRLVWTFVFQRLPDPARWEVTLDAHSGEVLSLEDTNQYALQQVKGGVYPLTDTGICSVPTQCGSMQTGWPMPFANTGLATPNNFTNSAGIFDWTSGTVTTTLNGRYVRITDTCGAISASSATGSLDLGGTNNQHDCATPGFGGAGNTPASRSAFYEVNKLAEQARGWLPNNAWLQAQITANVNLNQLCNAFWDGSTINFFRSGGGCRNTGEIAAVFDHEWGHGLDDNDTLGVLSNSSEAYADIAAIYRLQASCVGFGFFDATSSQGCGLTADGTGANTNEALTGAAYCATDCSGVRDTDFAKHSPATAATPLGFVCGQCTSGTGPCGRQVHCSAAPVRQAAWDLVARDLTAAPLGYDSQSAFIVGNKIFYQGSGNIGAWHSCTCGSSANGCGAANGYMQWLAADDDNGNLNDGTPHMTAIFNAFNRHGIACSTPAAQNSGCAAGPSGPVSGLVATPGSFQVALAWTAASGATRYWVFRSEGHAGCNFGKALIAEVTGTTYTDTQVANGRTYFYNVVPAGASSACYGRAGTCVSATPAPGATPDFSLACSPSSLTIQQGTSGATTCTVTSINGFASAVSLDCANLPAGVSCAYDPGAVTPTASSTLTVAVASGTATGSYSFQARGTSGSLVRTANISLTVTGTGGGAQAAVFDTVLQAPKCGAVGSSCDTGASLVLGRDTMSGGAEANQPNTIADSCADGTSGTFHSDESSDRLKVSTVDGGDFAAGKQVRIDATVWVWTGGPTSDHLDLYYAADATSPAWVYLTTINPTAAQGGAQTFSATYILPAGAGLQAVRAQFRYNGTSANCSAGGFNDRDDLVFAVAGGQTPPPDVTATFDATLQAPRCATAGRSCDSGPSLLLGRDGRGPEVNQPNTIAHSCADGTLGTFHSDESNDRIRVSTVDGSAFAAGKQVRIDATVWAWTTPSADHLDLYFTANANNPTWTLLGTLTPTVAGSSVLSATYTLPAGPLQAVRARFRYQGSASPCMIGSFDDHDDLVFPVP